jgi:hypothetical protein
MSILFDPLGIVCFEDINSIEQIEARVITFLLLGLSNNSAQGLLLRFLLLRASLSGDFFRLISLDVLKIFPELILIRLNTESLTICCYLRFLTSPSITGLSPSHLKHSL